jgi:hypothetical protein
MSAAPDTERENAPLHVVTVRLTTDPSGITTKVSLADVRPVTYYNGEAASSGVCAALEATSRAVAQYAINVERGLLLRVDLERDGVLLRPKLDERSAELRDALKRLADAAETAVSSEPDMPTHESSMDDFDTVLDEARQLLKEDGP